MQELSFQVVINPELEHVQKGVVAFGDFEVEDGATFAQDGLQDFFEALLLGYPMPLTFVTRQVESVGTLVAIALFLHRDLAINPTTPNLVYAAKLVDRYKHVGLAHVDRDLADFLRLLADFFPSGLSKAEQGSRLETAVTWIRQYLLEGALPANPYPTSVPAVLDVGTNGFVVAASSRGDLEAAWVELYRLGYLRGVVFRLLDDRMLALAAKKSPHLQLDLRQAAEILNEAEMAMGEPPDWQAQGLWLRSPAKGSELPTASVVEVLVRL